MPGSSRINNIVLAGHWHSDVHEQPMRDALTRLGCTVHEFKWHTYYDRPGDRGGGISLSRRIQRRLAVGPVTNTLNNDLVAYVKSVQPDMVFVYRGDLIYEKTLRRLREACPGAILVGYNNDDPYSPRYPFWYWRHFIRAIPEYDLVLAYRHHNLADFTKAGAKNVRLMRSWFVPDRHFTLGTDKKYDVVFIGHAEDDGRLEFLESIVEKGYRLGLFGPSHYWSNRLEKSAALVHLLPVEPVWGAEYNRVLNESKVALCFFSSLNRDTYTRRCFEIPATGTVMLAQYSDDLASMFEPDQEAVFFTSREEMLDKLNWLLENEDIRLRIGKAGQQKVNAAGHDVASRMRELLQWCAEIKTTGEQGGPESRSSLHL